MPKTATFARAAHTGTHSIETRCRTRMRPCYGDTDTVLSFNASTGAFAGTFASRGGLDDQVIPKINAPEAKIEGVCTVARLIPRKTFAAAIPRETTRSLGETS